jgi:murein L,D-transpeptidase YcbB/YkuD
VKYLLLILLTAYSFSFAQTKETIKAYFEQSKKEQSNLDLFYKTRGYEPIFINNGQLTAVAQELDSLYSQLEEHGLIAADYNKQAWLEIKANKAPLNLETEIFLSGNILVAIEHHLTGRIDPMKVADDVKFNRKKMGNLAVISKLLTESPKSIFSELAPKTDQYIQLKDILTYLKSLKANNQWETIPVQTSVLKLGTQNDIILDIKKKLSLLGYKFTNLDNKFDSELEAIVADIASNKLVKAEKQIKPNSYFWSYINTDINSRIREVELQMEKARWLPDQLEPRHAFVNIANQVVTVNDKNLDELNPIMQFKSINGQLKRKTPSMRDRVVSVILNPTWTVTMNIFFNDKLKMIKKDVGYLARGRFKVIDLATDAELDPTTIDWNSVTRQNIHFQLVQQPSYNNALGVVKFPMTNKFSIYLHDTNERNLFTRDYRLLSSGCVRLEKPIDFAEYLLKTTPWSKEKIIETIAKPGETKDKDTGIYLKNSLPIYLINLTAEKKNNIIRFYDDFYGQNTDLYKSLAKLGFFKK